MSAKAPHLLQGTHCSDTSFRAFSLGVFRWRDATDATFGSENPVGTFGFPVPKVAES